MNAENPEKAGGELQPTSSSECQRKIEDLQARLQDAEELTLAISHGEVDALVVSGPQGEQVFTLDGADHAYQVMVETMSEGAVTIGQDGLILYSNRRFADMLKAPLQKVLGRSIYSAIEPTHLATFRALLHQGLGSSEISLLAENGTSLPAYVSLSVLEIDEGQKAWCLVVTDLTEQKRSEELVAAEKLARSIIEQAAEAIIVCDENGRITRFSNAAPRICEHNPTFKHFDDVFNLSLTSVEDEDKKISPISAALQGSTLLHVEAKFERNDGQLFYLLLNAGPLKNAEERIIGCVVTLTDITDRKQMEEELKKAKDELELRVLERTAELSLAKEELEATNEELRVELDHHIKLEVEISQAKQDLEVSNRVLQMELVAHQKLEAEISQAKQELELMNEELQAELEYHQKLEVDLIKAKDAAEAAANAKAAFLANMSHELRTPLNAVIGFSSLLLDEHLAPEHTDYIEGIRNSGEALLALINDILDVSRAERELVVLEYQPLSLRCCIEESMDMVATDAAKKGLNLAYTINYGTPDTIIGDPGRIRQILTNLLENAVKFTDKGGVSVSVSSKALEENKREILFEVKDTGIGIPIVSMGKLFHPFGQVETTLNRKHGGAGLGLVISKRLVELMGGRIWADSIPGVGSKFCFAIPAEVIPGRHLDLGELVKESEDINLSEKRPMSVLVAEDSPSNQRMIVEMLRRMGYRPDAVADGREVIQALELRHYDLILMDIKMPQMDGLEASRQIRKLCPPEKQPRIVAITAFAMEGDREKCLEAGMDDYLAKPVEKNDLMAILMKYSPEQDKQAT